MWQTHVVSRCVTLGLNPQRYTHARMHTHTHTRLTALYPGLPGWAGTRKVKPIWILLKQETVSGSGINWAICKSAHCSREITMPAPHHSVFTGRMPFLPPNQQRQNTDGCCQSTEECTKVILNSTKILRTLNFINIFLFWMIYLCYRELKLISYFNCYVSVCHKNYVWLTHTHTHTLI